MKKKFLSVTMGLVLALSPHCGTNDSVVGTFPQSYHDILTRNNQAHVWVSIPGADHDGNAISTGFYNFVSSADSMLLTWRFFSHILT